MEEMNGMRTVITNLEMQGRKNMQELADKFSSLMEVNDQDHKDQIGWGVPCPCALAVVVVSC